MENAKKYKDFTNEAVKRAKQLSLKTEEFNLKISVETDLRKYIIAKKGNIKIIIENCGSLLTWKGYRDMKSCLFGLFRCIEKSIVANNLEQFLFRFNRIKKIVYNSFETNFERYGSKI